MMDPLRTIHVIFDASFLKPETKSICWQIRFGGNARGDFGGERTREYENVTIRFFKRLLGHSCKIGNASDLTG